MPTKENELVDTERRDFEIAARMASLLAMVASLWFFVSPWSFYGTDNEASAWNAWLVGGLLVLLAGIRVWYPHVASGVSRFNAALAVWVFISPWVFGYTGWGARFINSMAVGVFVCFMSLVSARNTPKWIRW